MIKPRSSFILLIAFALVCSAANAQQITGVWRGKVDGKRVELKIIQNGDSLAGTSYYSGLIGPHKRYSIKGYFDPYDNSVVWWDEQLITPDGGSPVENSVLSVADFNCPGGNRMYLDGKTSQKKDPRNATGKVNLTKVANPNFHDEWDNIIDNYPLGGNSPYLIDSVSRIATTKKAAPSYPLATPAIKEDDVAKAQPKAEAPVAKAEPPIIRASPPVATAAPQPKPAPVIIDKKGAPITPPTIDELFALRKKVFASELPLEGDSIQLHFYDNAEVDGDSISVYLNNKMIFTHVRLTANPYVITLPVAELANDNELVMVAENLGAIPPNTAFMIAMIGGKRYEAYLESTEGSSSLIRFTKRK